METITRSQIVEAQRKKQEQANAGQQLHAKIKRSSKYYGQGQLGALFPVFIDAQNKGEYVVQGGPGGQYRLTDVNLFVVDNGVELRIS